MLVAALRRFLALLGVAAGVTVAGSLLIGLAGGVGARRALTLGFYLMGSFLLLAGFFVGNRGRTRVESEGGGNLAAFLSTRRLRTATHEEEQETVGTSAIFIAMGLSLLVAGVLLDARNSLV